MKKNKKTFENFLKSTYKLNNFKIINEYSPFATGEVSIFMVVSDELISSIVASISKDRDKAINLMKDFNPKRDWDSLKIEEFKGYTIVI